MTEKGLYHNSPFLSYATAKELFYTFLNLCTLAYTVSQVIQLRTSYLTVTDNLYLLNIGRMQRPGLLNANAVGKLTDGEGSRGFPP